MDDLPPFLENIFRVVDEAIFSACACIIHSKGMELHSHRSGVFVQIADKHFLVTAAHYLNEVHSDGFGSFLVQGEQAGRLHDKSLFTQGLATCSEKRRFEPAV